MNGGFFVGCGQPLRDLHGIFQRLALRKRAAVQHGSQVLAIEQFGDEIPRATVLPDVVNRQEVGMIQRGNRARLLFKAP